MTADLKKLTERFFSEHQDAIFRRTDRLFAALLGLQYVAGILAASYITPRTWVGEVSSTHVHVWAAIVLGGVLVAVPILFALLYPGRTVTRHLIAVGQMLDSALLIHLTGGRIETHFHVFGSLAFLACYRDWRVLVSASTVVALDHFLRGVYWPQSVYGILTSSPYRWIEHTGWVLFEDVFLAFAGIMSTREMWEIAQKRAAAELESKRKSLDVFQLRRSESALRDALQDRDTFLSICGHELKAPLATLKIQSQLAARSGNAEESTSTLAEQTKAQVDRLWRLVQDITDHSRIQTGKLTIELGDQDLTTLAREVVEQCAPVLEEAGCRVRLYEDGAVPCVCDRYRIEQVMTNLLMNVAKYASGSPVDVTVEARGDKALLRVRDHGPGVLPEDRDRIFQCFERSARPTSVPGLGLGLYISRKIVEQHGGALRLDSVPGAGATFTVEIPSMTV